MIAPSARASLLRIVAQAFPSLLYGYPRTYKVAAVRGDKTLDLVPPPDAPELPELDAVEQWGPGGHLLSPANGDEVSVVFLDADPTRPVVMSFAPPSSTAAVARVGDLDGRLLWDAVSSTLYYSASGNAPPQQPYVAVALNPNPGNQPTPSDVGTEIVITSGSDLVEAG